MNKKELRQHTKRMILLGIIIGIIGGLIFGGTYVLFSMEEKHCIDLAQLGCHDGCSIATKDSEGFLTNETWNCWEECNDYINVIKSEHKTLKG